MEAGEGCGMPYYHVIVTGIRYNLRLGKDISAGEQMQYKSVPL